VGKKTGRIRGTENAAGNGPASKRNIGHMTRKPNGCGATVEAEGKNYVFAEREKGGSFRCDWLWDVFGGAVNTLHE